MRKTYRASKNADKVCFCGQSIRVGMPVKYVKTSEIPANYLDVRGTEYKRASSHAAHTWCVENIIDG
jgi:hypothetical protein